MIDVIDLVDRPEETLSEGPCASDELGFVRLLIVAAPACLGLWTGALWGLFRLVG